MASNLYDVLVIGTASLDTLHLADGRLVKCAGGAGLYTALAAARTGATVGLVAPQPQPLPDALQPAAQRVTWLGPQVTPQELPRLEIAHHGGGQATLIDASWGAEAHLTPEFLFSSRGQLDLDKSLPPSGPPAGGEVFASLPIRERLGGGGVAAKLRRSAIFPPLNPSPPQLSTAKSIHIAALSSAQRQLDFVQALSHTSNRPLLSAGTYARLVYNETAHVRQLLEATDLFFMNENEAKGLFGSVERAKSRSAGLLFVTLDAKGVLVVAGTQVTHVPGQPVAEVDPTGAGDTFCGATLAGLAQGLSPIEAARQAVKLAAQTVAAVGPAALVD